MRLLGLLLCFLVIAANTGCSNKKQEEIEFGQQQKVELGTVLAVKTIPLIPEKIDSYGNVGVNVGSGYSGVYGSVDVATIGKLYRNVTSPGKALELIVKKDNGEIVAITQPVGKDVFKKDQTVKILIRNGEARVVP